jgi:hypothetical protein
MSGSTTGTIRMMASPDSTVSVLDEDSDGDGIPESFVKHKSGSGSASSTIKSGMSGSTTGTIRMQAAGGGPIMPSGEIVLEADLDGDGVMDNTSSDSVGIGGASRRLAVNNIGSSGQDGVSVDLRCSPDSAAGSTELRKNGAVVCADYSRHTPFHNKRTSSFFDVFTEVSIERLRLRRERRRLNSHNLDQGGEDGVEVQLSARPKGSMQSLLKAHNLTVF